ncbi:MAG: CHAT domain-containing protein [Planctomycetaceae bacterium]
MKLRIAGEPDWTITPTNRRARRTTAAAVTSAPLPACLQDGPFEVVEQATLTGPEAAVAATPRRGAREKVPVAADLTLQLDDLPAEPCIIVARQASGAVSFHLLEHSEATSPRRGRSRTRPRQATVSLPRSRSAHPAPASSRSTRTPRGLVKQVIEVTVLKVVDSAAQSVMGVLGRQLEQKLWRDAGRREGWVRVSPGAGTPAQCVPGAPPPGSRGRALLLLHGTFSNTLAAFRDLLEDPKTAPHLVSVYGDQIYGFEHFTISKTPEENVHELLTTLPDSVALTCDVITHSRGGLVLRTLHRELRQGQRPDPRLTLGKVILVAAPNAGTPLATPERWEQTLGWFANLLEMFPANPFVTAAGWISGSLAWLAKSLNRNLPGIRAMDAHGSTIEQLTQVPLDPAIEWYGLVADYRPDDKGFAARLADMGIDRFFQGANDLVVPTEGGRCWGNASWQAIPEERVGRFGHGGNLSARPGTPVMHTSFFAQSAAREFILGALPATAVATAKAGVPAIAALRGPLPQPQLPAFFPGMVPSLPADQLARPPALSGPPSPPGTPILPPPLLPPPSLFSSTVAPMPTEAPPGVLQREDERRPTPGETAWSRQDSLFLVVLPLPAPAPPVDQASPDGRTRRRRSTEPKTEAQLLASYSGASVLVPFHLRGREQGAGARWQTIFAKHRRIEQYAEGTIDRELLPEDIQTLGTALFETLFPDEVRRLYDQARFRDQRRKLNVVFTSMIPWVADLPWEFAFDPACGNYLATSDVRFVRGVLTAIPSDRIPDRTAETLKILVVSAQPRSLAALSLDDERRLVESSFRPLVEHGYVEIDVLAEATPDLLHARVRQAEYGEIDVVHFMGHGEFDEETQTGYLLFEDGQRNMQKVSTAHMRDILRSRGIKLVFLNACQSGQGGQADYNKGVAPGLVADGVPAVVANQSPVLDRSATTFAQHFYWCLAQGMSLGDAARESRIALNYNGDGLIDWGVPVLFARDADAVLCSAVRRIEVSDHSLTRQLQTGRNRGGAVSDQAQSRGRMPEGALPGGALPKGALSVERGPSLSGASTGRTRVALWDINSAIPGLEQITSRMNEVQNGIEFFALRKNAPFGAWKSSAKSDEPQAFLPAEQSARRLQAAVTPAEADFILALTDLPLVSGDNSSRTVWSGTLENPKDADINRITLFSSFGFQPPLQGEILKNAIINAAAQGLSWYWSAMHGGPARRPSHPAPAPRGPSHRVLQHNILEGTERITLHNALERGQIPLSRLDNLDALLDLVPRSNHLEAAMAPPSPQPSRSSRKTRAR